MGRTIIVTNSVVRVILLAAGIAAAAPASAELSANRVRRERRAALSARDTAAGNSPQNSARPSAPGARAESYVCPMHADYRTRAPGICGVCGMALQASSSGDGKNSGGAGRTADRMPVLPVTLTRTQASLLSMSFAEARFLRIEHWIRSSAARTGELRLSGTLPSSFGHAIVEGQNVRAFPMESRARIFSGKIQSVEFGKDGASNFEIALNAEFPAAEVYAVEIVESVPASLAVPSDAILFTGEGPAAFRISDEDTWTVTLEPVPVQIGRRGEVYYEIRSGLTAGDRVAQVGLFYLDAASKLQ